MACGCHSATASSAAAADPAVRTAYPSSRNIHANISRTDTSSSTINIRDDILAIVVRYSAAIAVPSPIVTRLRVDSRVSTRITLTDDGSEARLGHETSKRDTNPGVSRDVGLVCFACEVVGRELNRTRAPIAITLHVGGA